MGLHSRQLCGSNEFLITILANVVSGESEKAVCHTKLQDEKEILFQNMLSELKRGLLSLAVLQLLDEEQYGYSLQKELSDYGFEVEQGTLYPLLRRLESQGWLTSDWRLAEETEPRRYYHTNAAGKSAAGAASGMDCVIRRAGCLV